MKRYLLFANLFGDAKGGFGDFIGDFKTYEKAHEIVADYFPVDGWWEIVDFEKRLIYSKQGQVQKFFIDEHKEVLKDYEKRNLMYIKKQSKKKKK